MYKIMMKSSLSSQASAASPETTTNRQNDDNRFGVVSSTQDETPLADGAKMDESKLHRRPSISEDTSLLAEPEAKGGERNTITPTDDEESPVLTAEEHPPVLEPPKKLETTSLMTRTETRTAAADLDDSTHTTSHKQEDSVITGREDKPEEKESEQLKSSSPVLKKGEEPFQVKGNETSVSSHTLSNTQGGDVLMGSEAKHQEGSEGLEASSIILDIKMGQESVSVEEKETSDSSHNLFITQGGNAIMRSEDKHEEENELVMSSSAVLDTEKGDESVGVKGNETLVLCHNPSNKQTGAVIMGSQEKHEGGRDNFVSSSTLFKRGEVSVHIHGNEIMVSSHTPSKTQVGNALTENEDKHEEENEQIKASTMVLDIKKGQESVYIKGNKTSAASHNLSKTRGGDEILRSEDKHEEASESVKTSRMFSDKGEVSVHVKRIKILENKHNQFHSSPAPATKAVEARKGEEGASPEVCLIPHAGEEPPDGGDVNPSTNTKPKPRKRRLKIEQRDDNGIKPVIARPEYVDVLWGTGIEIHHHRGNRRMRKIASRNFQAYAVAASGAEKKAVLNTVMSKLKKAGTRFLKRDEEREGWTECNNSEAQELGALCRFIRSFVGAWQPATLVLKLRLTLLLVVFSNQCSKKR
jgi:hypothetical protein